MIALIRKELQDAYRFRMVTISHVQAYLRMRYKRSVLGFFWSLLGPVLSYIVIAVVFSYASRVSMKNYFVYVFSGAAIFNLLAVTVNNSTTALISNESYIKKIYLPKSIFVMNILAVEVTNFLFAL